MNVKKKRVCKVSYSDGSVLEKYYVKNGKLDGPYRVYYENGKVEEEQWYRNGIRHGICREYYEDGRIAIEGMYKNGKEDGVWKYYFDNKVNKIKVFNKGKIIRTIVDPLEIFVEIIKEEVKK